MNSLLKLTFTSFAALALANSCGTDDFGGIAAGEICFRSGGVTVDTRSFTEADDDVLKTDGFRVAAVKSGDDDFLFDKVVTYVPERGVYRVPDGSYQFDDEHSISFYGAYPVGENLAARGSVNDICIPYAHDTDVDLVAASAPGVTKQSEPVLMEFSHLLSQVSVRIKGDDPGLEYRVKRVKFTSPNGGLYSFTDGGWAEGDVSAILGFTPEMTDYAVYDNPAGQTLASGTLTDVGSPISLIPGTSVMSIAWDCTDGGEVVSSQDQDLEVEFQMGKHTTLNITLPSNMAAISLKTSVTDWVYEDRDIVMSSMAPVAMIGEEKYASVSAAFEAVLPGQTVQLLDNCSFDSRVTLAGVTGEVTLDLNGFTLTNGPTDGGRIRRLYLNTDATLTIKDSRNAGGMITSDTPDQDVIRIVKGNLRVVSGTVKAPDAVSGGNAAIWVEPSDDAPASASVTVTGGSIEGPASVAETPGRAYALYVSNADAEVAISGGTFTAQSNNLRINAAGGVDITGGTFTCATNGEYCVRLAGSYTCNIGGTADISSASTVVFVYSDEGATEGVALNVTGGRFRLTTDSSPAPVISRSSTVTPIEVSGGLFNVAVSSNYLKDGCACVPNTAPETMDTYGYAVTGMPMAATLILKDGTSAGYPTLEKAVAAANDAAVTEDCTIRLLDDCALASAINVTNTDAAVTLDLNGSTLTHDGTIRLGVGEGAHLVIDDLSLSGGGRITQTSPSSSTISLTRGTLTLKGGTIEKQSGASYNTVVVSGGTFNIAGGSITNPAKAALSVSGGSVAMTSGTVNSPSNAVSLTGGGMSVSGGELVSTGASAISITGTNDCTLTVSGSGTISTTAANAIYSGTTGGTQTVTISGGRFSSSTTGSAILSKKSLSETPTTYVVSGGLFSSAPRTEYLAAFCECHDNDDPTTSAAYPVKVISH